MIAEVMNNVHNHFAKSVESRDYKIVADGVEGTFSETYVVGAYIWILGSFVNDGVYKVAGVTSTKITVEEALTAEDTGEVMNIFSCAPPTDFISLVSEIETYTSSSPSNGVQSKKLGDLSITYSGDSTWNSVYSARLNKYRKVYDDHYRLGYWD